MDDKVFCVTYQIDGNSMDAFVIAPSFSEAINVWREHIEREYGGAEWSRQLEPLGVGTIHDGLILRAS